MENLTNDQITAIQTAIWALALSGPTYMIWLARKIWNHDPSNCITCLERGDN